jgi:hypothetical protein
LRHPPKRLIRYTPVFYLVDPAELDGAEEWAEWLQALLEGMCTVVEDGDQLVLAETRARVDSGFGSSFIPATMNLRTSMLSRSASAPASESTIAMSSQARYRRRIFARFATGISGPG